METMNAPIITCRWHSPVGEMLLGAHDGKLCLCDWVRSAHVDANLRRIQRHLSANLIEGEAPVLTTAIAQLTEYFNGSRQQFTLPYILCGTDFQQRAWHELTTIPYGSTISYGEQARRMGCPTAVRAVASANARNAISIIVPCHRVIGSDHRLTGYAAGVDIKRQLLDIENQTGSPIKS